ncbi:MAG: imm11 family protein [Pyrinomonadaceae bacterium]
MRNIYLLNSDTSHYRGLQPPENNRFMGMIERFDGTPIGAAWDVFEVTYDDDSIELPLSDFASLTFQHIPVFSKPAARALRSLLAGAGELLPLRCGEAKYLAFNVTALVDALDLENSEVFRFASGKIMDVKTYVLDGERLGSAAIFKLTETPLMDVFVSDEFVNVVETAGLTGFLFKQVKIL